MKYKKYDPYIVGENIRRRRKMKAWSQNDLGNRLDMDRSEIGKYENGKTEMRMNTFCRFCEVLDADLDEMVFGEDEMTWIHWAMLLSEEGREILRAVAHGLYLLENGYFEEDE